MGAFNIFEKLFHWRHHDDKIANEKSQSAPTEETKRNTEQSATYDEINKRIDYMLDEMDSLKHTIEAIESRLAKNQVGIDKVLDAEKELLANLQTPIDELKMLNGDRLDEKINPDK